jgi:hypothetical protein
MTSSKYTAKVHRPWKEIVTEKRAIQDAQIEKHSTAGTNTSLNHIVSKKVDIEILTSLLRGGKVSAVEVIHAYIRRDVEIHNYRCLHANRHYRACEAQKKVAHFL